MKNDLKFGKLTRIPKVWSHFLEFSLTAALWILRNFSITAILWNTCKRLFLDGDERWFCISFAVMKQGACSEKLFSKVLSIIKISFQFYSFIFISVKQQCSPINTTILSPHVILLSEESACISYIRLTQSIDR